MSLVNITDQLVPRNVSLRAAPDRRRLEDALDYARRGWHILQVKPRKKVPVATAWQNVATVNETIIKRWWAVEPFGNIGVQLGPRSGIIDVECDSESAERELGTLLAEEAPVVPTFRGKRGKHRLFLYTPDLPSPTKAVFKFHGIEFRTGNGYKGAQSLFPPSIHPDGSIYTWLVHPDDADPVAFPGAALAAIRKELDASPAPINADPEVPIPETTRNLRLTSMAGSMRRAGFDREEIEVALLGVNRRRCRPPLGVAEVRGIARSITRYPPNAPRLAGIVHSGVLPSVAHHRPSYISFEVEV
jgi:hypothetical protein